MRSIIVPTDFSIRSYSALELAIRVAKKVDGTIYLIHVLDHSPGKYSGIGEIGEYDVDDLYTENLIANTRKELARIKKSHADRLYEIKTEVLIGDPYRKIREFVVKESADLVIIGAKGQTDTEEFSLGSLTDKIVRSMPIPVISVKVMADEDEFKNIVYATDLEEEQSNLMLQLIKFQELFESNLHIVKINTQKKFRNDIDTMVELQRLADKYQLKDYTLNCYGHEDEGYGVVYFADEKQADLIAMGTHERTGIRRLISGGTLADEVTDHTFRPVLTCRFQPEKV